jgi:hypothetical protein
MSNQSSNVTIPTRRPGPVVRPPGGAKASEMNRMATAFEHEDLNRALKL